MSDQELPSASIRVRRRLSIIWIVPIVALLATAWLGIRALSDRGTVVEITMRSAEGLEAGKSTIKHHNITLGTVEAIVPSADLASVTIEARMNRFAKPFLCAGTRFWVVRPHFSLQGVSGLGTLISGSYLEMDPGTGRSTRKFQALEDPPVVTADVPGTTFILHTRKLSSINQGAPITFHGLRVGEVLGYSLSDVDGSATIKAFVRAPHDQLVHDGSRFWNASGISVEVAGDGLRLQTDSLESVLGGGISFDVPLGGDPGPIAKPSSGFTLFSNEVEAKNALFTQRIPFLIHLKGSAQGLAPGASVRMLGIYVGEVTDVHMEYNAATQTMSVPVTFEVEPQRVKILNSMAPVTGFEARSYAAFETFVARGLRARLGSGNLLTGQKIVSLDFLPGSGKAHLISGGLYPEIPTVASSDLDGVMQSANDLLKSLKGTSAALHQIVTAPEVKRSLVSLDRTLANLNQVTRDASAQTGPLLANLRTVSKSADDTLRQVTATLAATGDDLAGTLKELKDAARSLHALTDYLESHPESLIRGKAKGDKR
jgi:paraquat-inducible protein B